MTIVFEAYAPTGTSGTLSARLPPLRSRISTSAKPALVAQLPPLGSSISGFQTVSGTLSGKLPPLRSRLSTRAKPALIGQLPPLRGYFSGAPTPSANTLIATLPPLRSNISGFQTIFGTLNGELPPLRSRISTSAKPALIARLPPLRGAFYQLRGNSVTCIQSQGYLSITGTGPIGAALSDGMRFSSLSEAEAIYLLQAKLGLHGNQVALLDALEEVGDALGFADLVGIAYQIVIGATLALLGDQTAWRAMALEVVDVMALAAGAGSTLDAQTAVAAALAFGASLTRVFPESVAEGVKFSAAQNAQLQAMMQVLDTLRMESAATPSLQITALVDERFALAAGVSASAELQVLINEGVDLLAQIVLDDGVYLAWVLNTESRAFTQYSNFHFNSFARIPAADGQYYGAREDGIYLLEGDDDAGVPIDAFIRGGLSDFGTGLLKRQHAMYLGYTTDGRMVVKVTAINDQGLREEHWYSLEDRPAGALTMGRVKIGKGLKSTYWGWELANVDGADFSLDSIAWYPMVLERRLN